MTRRGWCARLAALLPFAGRFQGPVALGSLRVGERFRFAHPELAGVWTRSVYRLDTLVGVAGNGWHCLYQHSQELVYRVR